MYPACGKAQRFSLLATLPVKHKYVLYESNNEKKKKKKAHRVDGLDIPGLMPQPRHLSIHHRLDWRRSPQNHYAASAAATSSWRQVVGKRQWKESTLEGKGKKRKKKKMPPKGAVCLSLSFSGHHVIGTEWVCTKTQTIFVMRLFFHYPSLVFFHVCAHSSVFFFSSPDIFFSPFPVHPASFSAWAKRDWWFCESTFQFIGLWIGWGWGNNFCFMFCPLSLCCFICYT